MLNPFRHKKSTFNVACKGLKKTFKVTTACGNVYIVTRVDKLHFSCIYPEVYLLSPDAEGLAEERCIRTSEGIYVRPVEVSQIGEQEILITNSREIKWLWCEPILYTHNEAISISHKVEYV